MQEGTELREEYDVHQRCRPPACSLRTGMIVIACLERHVVSEIRRTPRAACRAKGESGT